MKALALRNLVAALAALSTLWAAAPLQAETFHPGWRFDPPPGNIIGYTRPPIAVVAPVVVDFDVAVQVQAAPVFARQVVTFATHESQGTIIVDTRSHFLYYVLGGGQAVRYGIGVARSGFEWSGTHRVSRKAEWPGWTPPAEMLRRQPHLPRHMEGGINNPLGARALYLGSTLYRIHGTNEPWTIGQDVSSGCIRMINDDVIDLYARVTINTKVVVF